MGKFWSKQQAIELKKVKLNQLQNNLKQGLWKEQLLDQQLDVFEMGEYLNGQRIGKWIWLKSNKIIAGGFYDDKGKKKGKWSELQNINKMVIYWGEYNMNNMKVGRWDIMCCKWNENEYKQIIFKSTIIVYSGGGSYDYEGNQKKIGKWGELGEGFCEEAQVTYNGKYDMNNMKVGRWDIMYCKWNENEYKQIGGGSYDLEGNQKKIGKWVELIKGFQYQQWISKLITYNGKYDMNMKVGRWDVMFCKYGQKEYKQIGGGSYDKEGNQKKIGKWVELDENFSHTNQVTHMGEYNMNNVKVGRWDIMYCWSGEEYQQIGGGSYDQEGNQKKIGKWVELDEQFEMFRLLTYNGEYDMKGQKVGIWVEVNIARKNKKKRKKQK